MLTISWNKFRITQTLEKRVETKLKLHACNQLGKGLLENLPNLSFLLIAKIAQIYR